jgi:iron complex outermembrane receptor protein
VTATRVEENSFDLPISIDVVESESIHNGQLAMSVAESLVRVPGLTSNDRSEMSQDTQIGTRGFGARSTFGVQGLRLYEDGISLSSADGISFPGSINLDDIKSIEVMRGPFSALYGSSSGGVIQFLTKDAPKNNEITSSFMAGSYGTTKESLGLAGTEGNFQYFIDTTTFNTNGYRDHSAAHEEENNAKLKWSLENGTRIEILANYMNLQAQDPLGSVNGRGCTPKSNYDTECSVFTNPTASPTLASNDNTGVHKENTQVGVTIAHDIDQNNTLNLINYVGHRINSQILSGTQYPAASSSVANLATTDSVYTRDFFGNEVNWANKGMIFNHHYDLTTGLAYGSTRDNRGTTYGCAGITGLSCYISPIPSPIPTNTVKRSEIDNVSNLDEFIQSKIALMDNLDLHMGARNTNINYNFNNITQTGGNGSLHFSDTTSVMGATWKVTPTFNLYSNYGRGFETPTLSQAFYGDSSGLTGNFSIKPMTSNNYEIGAKSFLSNSTIVNLAIFRTDTNNEIVVTNSTTTNTVYGNVGSTMRQGLEFSIDSKLPHNFSLYGAYTYLDAQYESSYNVTGAGNGTVNAGNRLPGTYRNQIYTEVAWKYPSLNFTSILEGRYMSKTFADDLNQNFAPSYTVFNLRTGFQQTQNNWKFSEYFRINNVLGENYIGAVRIDDFKSRFFEAAPGRNYLVGLSATYGF